MLRWRIALTVPVFALLTLQPFDAASPVQKLEASRMSMACLYSIVAHGARPKKIAAAMERALDEVDRIDRLMSHYRDDSPLSRLNREAARRPVAVDRELFEFIALALDYGAESDAAFDITVGPLMQAWGFFRGDGRMPTDAELSQARSVTGLRHIRLDRARRTIRFDREGVSLDLGGIAKGYAVDRAVGVLRRAGIASALVNAGGSTIYALGAPPGAPHWPVDIEDPTDARKIAFTVGLKDRALSVAGASQKFFEHDGVRYSHIMDPRTGRPVRGLLGVIVEAPTGTAGDAADDVLFVQGIDRGRAFLGRHPEIDASFLVPIGESGWARVSAGRRSRTS